MIRFPRAAVGLATSLLLAPLALHAQTTPDAGSLLRDIERSQTPRQTTPALPDSPAPAGPTDTAPGARVTVKSFRLLGVQLIPEAEVQQVLAPWVGQPASFADLRRAADAVAALYQRRGYLVRAYLPDQEVQSGEVAIVVLEGRLAGVRIDRADGATHIGDAQVQGYMTARQRVGEPVRPEDIQRAISLLNDLPGVSASSLLEPGTREGESVLVVAVRDKPRWSGLVQADNTGAKASGEVRATVGLNLNSPLGRGDQAQLLLNSSRDSHFGSLGYSAPIGYAGLRVGLNALALRYGYGLQGTRYSGDASGYGASLAYPLLRSERTNLNASLALDQKHFDNDVAGIPLNDKSLRSATLSLYGDRVDDVLGGGLVQYGLSWSEGRLDLSGNAADLAADQVANGPRRDGRYRKLGWSLSRLQRVTTADTLALIASGQFANRNLDSSEKFVATGAYGVRAYSSSEPAGDDASLLSVEWRHQFSDALTATVFHDRARIRRDHHQNTASLAPNRFSLAGSGLGVSWGRSSDAIVRATVAWRHGRNPAADPQGRDSDGTHRTPRVFVSVLKTF